LVAHSRDEKLLKNEFLEALFIDKVCFILFALLSRVDPEKKVIKMMLKLVDGLLIRNRMSEISYWYMSGNKRLSFINLCR